MPQASAVSSIGDFPARPSPEASPGARMNSGVPMSRRTASWRRGDGRARVERCETSADGSKKSSKLLVAVHRVMSDRGQPAVASPCRVAGSAASGARWPTGPNICSRGSTSLTGRPIMRAASDAEDLRPRQDRPLSRSRRRGTGCGCGRFPAGCRRGRRGRPRHGQRLARRVDRQAVAVPRLRRWRAAPSHCGIAAAFRRSRRCVAAAATARPRRRHARCSAGAPTPTACGTKRSQRRGRCAPARPRSGASAARRLRSPPQASRRRRRAIGWLA